MNTTHPTAVIYPNVILGDNIVIGAHSVIGGPGFVYEGTTLRETKLGVRIEDGVHIGANCCIDAGYQRQTVIKSNSRIDNLVQIAHDVIIGKDCHIVAQCGIAGYATIGNGVVLAGQVGIADHVTIGDGAIVGAKSGVHRDVPSKTVMLGNPARPIHVQAQIEAILSRLPDYWSAIKQMHDYVKEMP